MGWTGYVATHYKKGKIDRKAECDAYFLEYNPGCYEILKSTLRGSVYYAAVRKNEKNAPVFAVVFLTRIDKYLFWYKDMDESMGPYERNCPVSILNLLSPTDNEWANEWRDDCRKNAEKNKSPNTLANLPIGAVIRFELSGKVFELTKHAPAYQFKRPFWYNATNNTYMKRNCIPNNYDVVTV